MRSWKDKAIFHHGVTETRRRTEIKKLNTFVHASVVNFWIRGFDSRPSPCRIILGSSFPKDGSRGPSPVTFAEVAELADAHGSGPCTRKGVGVRVPSSAPKLIVLCCALRVQAIRHNGFAATAGVLLCFLNQRGFQIIGIGPHLTGCNLLGSRALKTQLANTQAIF